MTDSFPRIEEVRTTIPSLAAAEQLAAAIVELRLAACVQIAGPIQSVYRWHGVINKDQEYSMSCKTSSSRQSSLIAYLKAHHPYELPEVISIQMHATPEYANWLNDQVS